MQIRYAGTQDIPGLDRLLSQVLTVHHNGRPDLFRANARKYNDDELKEILEDTTRPVFVADDGAGNILGYAFCVFQQHINDNILTDIKSLYIDDLCVDENCRGQHIGQQLYRYVLDYAKASGCYNVTLNVWACNENARKFYEKCGSCRRRSGWKRYCNPGDRRKIWDFL